ncbi:PVC-type heme-binding CxxCH protein [Larkinella insperata]|uniref:PVC-type heme-binding CxxCH protein n=1 Tax=Larkinella insperata TaxID=332158 RepID=A0ABW3QKY9_9BACT
MKNKSLQRGRRRGLVSVLSLLLVWLAGCGEKPDADLAAGAVPPEKALATLEVEEGFQIELLAHEPLIASPVDMEIDEDGRLYVVEMPGYPLDKSGSGKIKLLADTDGDGKMDKSTVFAEGLTLPNGIMRWKKGILVTDAPDVLYLEDTDGDGKADVRSSVLTGFSLSNPHINVNNPVYGLDNWVYLAHLGAISTRKYEKEFGDQGGAIRFPQKSGGPSLPKNADGRTVRFRPDAQQLEMTSSRSQFGHTFDPWGNHFLTFNQNHIYQEVMAAAYVGRNPDLPLAEATQSISDHGDATEVFQITHNPDRQLFTPAGLTTSSSGITAYTGGAFPEPFNTNAVFVTESVSNLVHVDLLKDKGASFVASRHHDNKEFLASTDSWFRPVNMYVGPDGALYVLDYYRQIIEHPEWMSDEAIQAGGLYNGKDKGRIYRITPKGTKRADWTAGLKLGDATNEELVEKLTHPNQWWRMHAQRLLVDQHDAATVPALETMAKHPTSPLGRLHALWTLEGMGKLTPGLIERGLRDSVAGVRQNAIKLAELHRNNAPGLTKVLPTLQNDPDPKVRYQLLCTLGFINSPESDAARQRLLFHDLDDPWVQVAALSASAAQTGPLLDVVLKNYKPDVAAYASLVQRLTAMVGAGKDAERIRALIRQAISPESTAWQAPVLAGLSEGLSRRQIDLSSLREQQRQLVQTCFDHPAASVRRASLHLLNVVGIPDPAEARSAFNRAVKMAGNSSLPDEKRTEALDFLALGDPTPQVPLLKKLITPREQPAVQLAALRVLSRVPDQTAPQYALQQWPALTPEIRAEALAVFMSNPERTGLLLDALESGKIQTASLGWSQKTRLMGHSDEKLRDRARALLLRNDEQKINGEYQKALGMKGDAVKGKAVYGQNCSLCHQVRGQLGVAYGPDLGTVHNWLPKDIMANVLAPNLSIAPGFDFWSIELNDGSSLQGTLASETSAAITVRTAPGVAKTLNRQRIKSLKLLNMSPMPSFAGQIDQQQMADLLAFLRQKN